MVEIRLDLVEGVRDRDQLLLNFSNLNYLFLSSQPHLVT